MSIIVPPENTRIFDHILFTFNWKRMGLLTSALRSSGDDWPGQSDHAVNS
ncbi:hypothetical protein N8312_00450 [bacterium]|nr:hypothetical protein [bacterium]